MPGPRRWYHKYLLDMDHQKDNDTHEISSEGSTVPDDVAYAALQDKARAVADEPDGGAELQKVSGSQALEDVRRDDTVDGDRQDEDLRHDEEGEGLNAKREEQLGRCDDEYDRKAIQNFATARGLVNSEVTLQMVCDSEEKYYHWAFLDENLAAGGTLNRQMWRQLEKPEFREAREVAKHLPPAILKKLRAAWASGKKKFDFVTEEKEMSLYSENLHRLRRIYLTETSLAREFGSVDDEESKDKAWRWACGCWHADTTDDVWLIWSEWLGEYKYGYEVDAGGHDGRKK